LSTTRDCHVAGSAETLRPRHLEIDASLGAHSRAGADSVVRDPAGRLHLVADTALRAAPLVRAVK
jgi:hypothetical protein